MLLTKDRKRRGQNPPCSQEQVVCLFVCLFVVVVVFVVCLFVFNHVDHSTGAMSMSLSGNKSVERLLKI